MNIKPDAVFSSAWDILVALTTLCIHVCATPIQAHANYLPDDAKLPGTRLFMTPALEYGDVTDSMHSYVQLGDVNLGAVFSIHNYSEHGPCGAGLRDPGVIQHTEAMIYALQLVNRDPSLLPNVSLGFVILDDCLKPTTALAQVIHFMPGHDRGCASHISGTDAPPSGRTFYDVIGVIGAESSTSSIMMANVLTLFEIPQISHTSTSDLLSDKNKFPLFMRLIPPDRFQVLAMVEVLLEFGWTHVSLVYTEGGYGQHAAERLHTLAAQRGICIGASLPVTVGQESFSETTERLYASAARVVILFTDQEEARGVLTSARTAGLARYFTWVGSDGIGLNVDDLNDVSDVIHGALVLKQYSVPAREFEKYFLSLSPGRDSNPWLRLLWEELFSCDWFQPSTKPPCDRFRQANESKSYTLESTVPNIIDTVYTFAHALHSLRARHCATARGNQLRECVRTNNFLRYLRDTTFSGLTGNVSFDDRGDVLGSYEILNLVSPSGAGRSVATRVGVWDARTEELSINRSAITWNAASKPPKSRCGEKCRPGEIYFYFKNTCCWECRSCNKNEITLLNATRCESCPLYTWPEAESLDACVPIPPRHVTWSEPWVIVLNVLSTAGLVFSTVIFVLFVRNNEARIIKATSRELSYIMLGGVTIQYLLICTSVVKPQTFVCHFNYIGFNVSFAGVYAPLLTRTNRIYRIFSAGKRSKLVPSLTSPLSQILISCCLIAVQVLMNLLVSVWTPVRVSLRQPVILEQYVELICEYPERGLICSMCYNLLLVLVCTFYAFKTRALPDNFNESRCISLCVYTTLVIWLAFLPTYFTTPTAYFQVILISCALLLNATVTLLCLYVPKLCGLNADDAALRHNTSSSKFMTTSSCHGINMSLMETSMVDLSGSGGGGLHRNSSRTPVLTPKDTTSASLTGGDEALNSSELSDMSCNPYITVSC